MLVDLQAVSVFFNGKFYLYTFFCLSGGEDGCVKMWSRNGMLRSLFANVGKPVYCLDWNKDSSKLVYCAGEECYIKLLNAQVDDLKQF